MRLSYFTFIFVVITAISFQSTLQAQPKDVSFMIGGGAFAGYSSTIYESNSASMPNPAYTYKSSFTYLNIALTPLLGYFVSTNVVLGCQIIPALTSYKSEDLLNANRGSSSTTYISIGISPFVRYFFSEIGTGIFPFADMSLAVQPQFNTSAQQSSSSSNSIDVLYSGTIGIGISIFFNRNMSLEPSIRYNYGLGINPKETRNSNVLSLGINWQLFLRTLHPEVIN